MYKSLSFRTLVIRAAVTSDHVQAIGLVGAEVGITCIQAKTRSFSVSANLIGEELQR